MVSGKRPLNSSYLGKRNEIKRESQTENKTLIPSETNKPYNFVIEGTNGGLKTIFPIRTKSIPEKHLIKNGVKTILLNSISPSLKLHSMKFNFKKEVLNIPLAKLENSTVCNGAFST
jgi:hypothetical protein